MTDFQESTQQNTRLAPPVTLVPSSCASVCIPEKTYSIPIGVLDLSIRVYNLLTRAGITLVGQLLEMEKSDFARARLGERSIDNVIRRMYALGLLDQVLSNQEEGSVETSQASQETTSTTPIEDQAHFLEHGWEIWSIIFAAPLGQNPELWRHAGNNRGQQWSLPYCHGDFPLPQGAIVTYDTERTKLRRVRREQELSQFELAEMIGYRREDIEAWEHGTVDPDPDAISRLCAFFDEDPDDLELPRKFYMILSIGSNTLTMRAVTDEDLRFFTKEELQEIPPTESYGQSRSPGRQDKRQRPGRGKLRDASAGTGAEVTAEPHFYHKVPCVLLPDALRAALPYKDPRQSISYYCYVQPFMLIENQLVEWQPGEVRIPDHYRVARTPMELREANIIHVEVGRQSSRMLRSPDGQTFESLDDTEQRLSTLAWALINPAVPRPVIRVAPSYFLSAPDDCSEPSLQQLIALGVSFPEAMLLPDSCIKRRVDLSSGAQIAIPDPIRHARIERLHLSEKTLDQLRRAKLTTLGDLLSQEEESLQAALDETSLWEVYVALCQKQALPQYTHPFEVSGIDVNPKKSDEAETKTLYSLPVSGWLSAELLEETDLGQPAFPTVYLQMTGVTYDDAELGRLHLVHVSPFVDCFDGKRSGPVNTIWLTQAQIDQSRPWDRDFERLDVLEAREQVAKYARVHGAIPPEVRPVERSPREYDKVRHQQQEQYRIVPLKDPDNPVSKDSSGEEREKPLELFIGSRDLAEAQAKRESQTAMMRRVIRRYINHPTAQSLGVPLSRCVLQDIYDWLGKDRDKRRELPSGRIRPYGPNLIMHKEYRYHERLFPNQGGEMVWQNVPDEVVGYRVIIGVLVITQVEDDLIVHPRESKPVSPVPERPIRQSKWPNYVPIQEAMVA